MILAARLAVDQVATVTYSVPAQPRPSARRPTAGAPPAPRPSAAAVTVAELVTAPTYEWEGDDDDGEGEDEAEAEDGPVRFRPLTELTVTACLWQQRWCWRLRSPRAAEILLGKVIEARRSEGWWCSSPPSGRSALLCRSLTLQRAGQEETIEVDGQQNTAASLLQYGVVVAGSSVLATFWQEPQHGTLLLQNSTPVGAHLLLARIVKWLAQCDGHLAGAVSALMQLRVPEVAAPLRGASGRKMSAPPVAPLPSDLTLPVQHTLPHGRYYVWPLRAFDAPIRHEPLLHRLEKLLHEACDGAVRFGEQLCTATSACVPVPPSELQLDLSAGDQSAAGASFGVQTTCAPNYQDQSATSRAAATACAGCAPGKVSPAGGAMCVACAAGFFANNASLSDTAPVCDACAAGRYALAGATKRPAAARGQPEDDSWWRVR